MIGDAEHIFPAEDGLFEDTFSTENTYRVHGLNITIHQDYSASLGVAASVWDSVSYYYNYILIQQDPVHSEEYICVIN